MSSIPYLQTYKTRGVTYYRYRMPDGSYQPLGKNKAWAEEAARLANEKREAKRVDVGGGETMLELVDAYEPVKLRTTKSPRSQAAWRQKFNQYRRTMAAWRVSRIGVRDLDGWMEEHAPQYDPYRLHRLMLKELFAYALGKGWRSPAQGNPGEALLPPKLARPRVKKQRRRITLKQFFAVREFAPEWLQLGMDLSLQTGIRRGDLCALRVDAYQDGKLRFIPAKTADLANPVAVSISMGGELFNRSRAMAPTSPYFLHKNNSFHRTAEAEAREHWTQILPEQLTRAFKKARDKAVEAYPELFEGMKDEELPTHHEIRALCSWLYREEGRPKEDVQTLLGHQDIDMTEYYQSGHEVVWQETWAGLKV